MSPSPGLAIGPKSPTHLITPLELPTWALRTDQWHHQLPPPGTELLWTGPLGPVTGLPSIEGLPSEGKPGDKWWSTLKDMSLGAVGDPAAWILRIAADADPAVLAVLAAEDIPIVYDQGGETMRWIKSTIRGTLAGIEEFQFGINWGNPGADPDPNDAETLAFATSLRDTLQSTLSSTYGAITPISVFPTDVKFTEVGAVVETQTSATASDGTGGDLTQKSDTQWAAYPVGGIPTGGASSVTLPFETSMAVTLQSDHRGPSGRGRLYLPPFGVGFVQAGGKFTSATVTGMGQWIGDLLHQMSVSSGHVPIVVSRRRLILNEITSVNVGAVPDSQRRRRRSQDEARVTTWTKP